MPQHVVVTMLGTVLDSGHSARRWKRWRPTVALCQREQLPVHRLELLCEQQFDTLAQLVASDIGEVSPRTEVRINHLQMDDPWDFEQVYAALHDFARAYRFQPAKEDYLVHITTGTHVAQICLFLLTESRHLPGRLLQTSPPDKAARGTDPGTHRIIDLDLSRYDLLASRFRQEQVEGLSFLKSGIETRSASFNRLIERIEQVAAASIDPLLLTGPTGAGKSQLARRIVELKRSRGQVHGELVEVNCATIRGEGAMSALFGHVKGAFTGARRDRPGLLRRAHDGVLLLDEIGELGLDEQAMLLRAIEERTFLPLGSDVEVTSNFQLIAGTNRDLRLAVRKGQFREDLLARIDLWTFFLPPLVQRREDLEPNLRYELARCSQRLGINLTLTAPARKRFVDFATSAEATWPANFRDFVGSITRMATLAGSSGRISLPTVDEEIERLRARWSDAAAADHPLPSTVDESQIDRFDRAQLVDVLRVCRGAKSLSAAGRELFAVSRLKRRSRNDADRLRKYLARFGLDFDEIADLDH